MTVTIEAAPITPENPYALSKERIAQLTVELLENRPPDTDDRFVCYRLDGNDPYADIARQVECEVFDKAFNNDPQEMQEEYGPYESQSIFFLSIDREKIAPTGALRIIEDGEAGLKTFNDMEKYDSEFVADNAIAYHHMNDMEKCWDIGTVAVPEEYRSAENGISLQLYRGMYVASKQKEIEHFISVIDKRPYDKMTKFLGFPFKPLFGSKPLSYLGSSESVPVYGDAPQFEEAVQKKSRTLKGRLAGKALYATLLGAKDDTLQF